MTALAWKDAAADGDLMYAVARETARQLDCDFGEALERLSAIAWEAGRDVTLDAVLRRGDVTLDVQAVKQQVEDRIVSLAAEIEASAPADRVVDPDGITIHYAPHVDLDGLIADEIQMARDFRRARDAELTLLDRDAFAEEWAASVDAGIDLVGTWSSERGVAEGQVDDADPEARAVTLMLEQDAEEDRILEQQRQARIRTLERAEAAVHEILGRLKGEAG